MALPSLESNPQLSFATRLEDWTCLSQHKRQPEFPVALKESDRLRVVAEHRTDSDHRMAMALLVAGYEVDDINCISKSYPHFLDHFRQLQVK